MNVGQLNFSGHFQAAGYAGDIIRRKFPQAAQLKTKSGNWGDLDIEYPDDKKDVGRRLMMLLVAEGVNFRHSQRGFCTHGRADYSPPSGLKFHEQTPARLKNRMERLINAGSYFQYNRPDRLRPNARVSYRA